MWPKTSRDKNTNLLEWMIQFKIRRNINGGKPSASLQLQIKKTSIECAYAIAADIFRTLSDAQKCNNFHLKFEIL